MKLYTIEFKRIIDEYGNGYNLYRFKSLFNGCSGVWRDTEEDANGDGNIHQNLLKEVYKPLIKVIGGL